jgi:hypothetical protein
VDWWVEHDDDRLIATAVAVLNERDRKAKTAKQAKGRRRG